MAYEHLTPRERIRIERAYSQALYYAQRGFADACRVYAPEIPADQRAKLTGVLGTFLHAYVIPELEEVMREARKREGWLPADGARLMERDTAPIIFDPTKP